MKTTKLALFVAFIGISSAAWAQEAPSPGSEATNTAADQPSLAPVTPATDEASLSEPDRKAELTAKAKELAAEAQTRVEEIAEKVDENESAKKAAEGILGPIYKLAESLNFTSFHWLAFGLMAAGVVSFALQLVLGKLVVLFRGSINLTEIMSDAVGLIISTLGLVLTTQAAAENSTFTHSAAAVLSATAFGVITGFMLYRWGQAQEVNAVVGQRAKTETKS